MGSTLRDRVRASNGDLAQTHKFMRPEDLLIGTIAEITKKAPLYDPDGEKRPVLVIEATEGISNGEPIEPGLYTVYATAHLAQLVSRKTLWKGDEVAIRFVKEVPSKSGSGSPMKAFAVEVDYHGLPLEQRYTEADAHGKADDVPF